VCVTSQSTSRRCTRSARGGAGEVTISPLAPQQVGARMVGVAAARHARECLVGAGDEAGAGERAHDRFDLRSLTLVDDRRAEAGELASVHHVLARRDEDLAGAHVHVERRRRRRPAPPTIDGDVAADVRLVR
jgi:hypothetical protein